MNIKYSKWIGGGLGWVLGGPIGAVVGFVVGFMFDNATEEAHHTAAPTQPGDFAISLVLLAGTIVRADGLQRNTEIDYIESFFKRNYGDEKAAEMMRVFNETVDKEYSLEEVCTQMRDNMEEPLRLQLMHFLFGIAGADGNINSQELDMLTQIADYLYINASEFESMKAMFVVETDSAYTVLGITKDVSDDEVKKAFRRMALIYHPDKVSHMGEEVIKGAEEKFRQLNEAYEKIKKQRGIN